MTKQRKKINHNTSINLRISNNLKLFYAEKAKQNNMTISMFLRHILQKHKELLNNM